jgi:V8-like Glu-specific endopeptidase
VGPETVPGPGSSFDVQIGAAESRYQRREATRDSFAAGSVAERVLQKNDPDRVCRRLERLGLGPEEIRAFLNGAGITSFAILPDRDAPGAAIALQLERILGRNDMVGGQFLEAGARAARPVGRVRIRTASGRAAGYGTGSLIGPRLLLTNNHVLGSATVARASVVELNVQEAFDGRPLAPEEFALTPEHFFLTDVALDFTLVAVAPRDTSGADLADFGWNRASESDDPVLVEEYVNIVQHPGGRPKQVALRDNQVVDLLDDFLHYRADTEPGSSGAPVFNDQWELVGLHHSGVPRRDGQGRIQTRGGGVWAEGMDERDIDWVANEGVRLSRILRFVKGQAMDGDMPSRLRDWLFAASPPEMAPPVARGTGERTTVVAPAPPQAVPAGEHGVTLMVPLTISLRLGAPSGAPIPTAVAPSGSASPHPPSTAPPESPRP